MSKYIHVSEYENCGPDEKTVCCVCIYVSVCTDHKSACNVVCTHLLLKFIITWGSGLSPSCWLVVLMHIPKQQSISLSFTLSLSLSLFEISARDTVALYARGVYVRLHNSG